MKLFRTELLSSKTQVFSCLVIQMECRMPFHLNMGTWSFYPQFSFPSVNHAIRTHFCQQNLHDLRNQFFNCAILHLTLQLFTMLGRLKRSAIQSWIHHFQSWNWSKNEDRDRKIRIPKNTEPRILWKDHYRSPSSLMAILNVTMLSLRFQELDCW